MDIKEPVNVNANTIDDNAAIEASVLMTDAESNQVQSGPEVAQEVESLETESTDEDHKKDEQNPQPCLWRGGGTSRPHWNLYIFL